MTAKIIEFLKDVTEEISFGIRSLCGRPSPMKRFIFVLIICGILSVSFMYTLVSSIYNMGKNDARKESPDAGNRRNSIIKNDSINFIKEKQHEQTNE